MAIDVKALGRDMGKAAATSLKGNGREATEFAKSEARKLADTLELIAKGVARGEISPERAELLLSMQRHASKSVLLAIEGIGILAAERAVNAALGVARDAVNRAVGFPLV